MVIWLLIAFVLTYAEVSCTADAWPGVLLRVQKTYSEQITSNWEESQGLVIAEREFLDGMSRTRRVKPQRKTGEENAQIS